MKKVLCVLFVFVACDENSRSSFSPDGIAVFTDRNSYSRTDPTVITIANSSSETVAAADCGSTIYYTRQKWLDGVWVDWTEAFCDVTNSRVIRPGDQLQDTIRVRKPGVYRFRYDLSVMAGDGGVLSAYSNPFEIY